MSLGRPVVRATSIPVLAGETIMIGDFHAGHKCVTFHATPFVTGSGSVFVNNMPCVRFGDTTLCKDMAIPLQGTVWVNNRPIATMGSLTSGHLPCYPPSICASGSSNVFATPGGV